MAFKNSTFILFCSHLTCPEQIYYTDALNCYMVDCRKENEARDKQARIQREREEQALKKLEEEERKAAEGWRERERERFECNLVLFSYNHSNALLSISIEGVGGKFLALL